VGSSRGNFLGKKKFQSKEFTKTARRLEDLRSRENNQAMGVDSSMIKADCTAEGGKLSEKGQSKPEPSKGVNGAGEAITLTHGGQ
jgi:hypothetical protein